MIGRAQVTRRLLEALLQAIVSCLLLTETCCDTTAAFASVSGSLTAVASGIRSSKFMDALEPAVEKPYFEHVAPRNVTAIHGLPVTLNCRVRHPGDRTVSWMRKRDLHILTSNIHTYTGDGRFSVLHPEHSDDWDLRIEYVQKRDAGVYECQVNTEPKINMAVYLTVEDAQASISGPAEVYVKKGSTISLTCSVYVHSTPLATLLWYHGAFLMDFDSQRGGISLETERNEAGITSKLLITNAALSDSGNYTCVSPSVSPASASVHVLNGEYPAAMQSNAICIHYETIIIAIIFSAVILAKR